MNLPLTTNNIHIFIEYLNTGIEERGLMPYSKPRIIMIKVNINEDLYTNHVKHKLLCSRQFKTFAKWFMP